MSARRKSGVMRFQCFPLSALRQFITDSVYWGERRLPLHLYRSFSSCRESLYTVSALRSLLLSVSSSASLATHLSGHDSSCVDMYRIRLLNIIHQLVCDALCSLRKKAKCGRLQLINRNMFSSCYILCQQSLNEPWHCASCLQYFSHLWNGNSIMKNVHCEFIL